MSMWSKRTGIMLAYPFNEGRIKRNFHLPLLVQPKLNGERCRALIKGNHVTLLSSEENEITSCPHIVAALTSLGIKEVELDGEIYCHELSRQRIHSIISRKMHPHEDHEKVSFNIFDLVSEMTAQFTRIEILEDNLRPALSHPLNLVPTHQCKTLEEVEALLIDYMKLGYEGIVIRDPMATYSRRRVTTMLKWKPRKEDSYLIVGYKEEVDKYGTPKNALGAIVCTSDGEEFSIGTGTYFTRDRRESLWAERDKLPGKYATIKYPELTDRGIPDHPVCCDISDVCSKEDYYE